MTGHSKEQIWVTLAVSEKDADAALTTGYSLRRVYTTRKIAVITSIKLPLNLRQALSQGFDFVFFLEEDLNSANLELEDFAKLYSFLALQSFDKCCFVSPFMVALKNCDDIFSEETDFVAFCPSVQDSSVFLFKPSADNYKSITTGLKNFGQNDYKNGFSFEFWLETHFNKVSRLNGKYNKVVDLGKPLTGSLDDFSIVNLRNFPSQADMEKLSKTGMLEELIAKYWLKIRNQDVMPLINSHTNQKANRNSLKLLQQQKEPIAIVGMSCRYPGSNNLEEFWNLLLNGEDATGNPPPFRWNSDAFGSNSRSTNAGFLKSPVDQFDAKFFGISPKEALFMDPQQRLMHELVWEALEDACIDPFKLRGTSGSIFMGSWTNDYKDILNLSGNQDFYRKYMGNSIGAATARLSFLLGLTGPSIATESGCSSGMVAVHLACKGLQNGETNLAIAGGLNLLLLPFEKDVLPLVISPDGRTKAFSEDANGFARAEGCGVLILKRFSDAVKDGDNIWALIRGTAIKQEGLSNSIGTPTVDCEALAMKMALKDAGVLAEQVSYVEAHGTGTVVGDPIEIAGIAKAYNSPKRTKPLIIGSVKTNLGHTESCSGIAGIMKVVLSMKNGMIPAHRNFIKLNPAIDLNVVPAVIPLERLEWKKKENGEPRIAGVSSFGITGTDAHMIVQEAPTDIPPKNIWTLNNNQIDRPYHLLKICAKTKEALINLLNEYKKYFENTKDLLSNVAYSGNIGRADFNHRAVIMANSKEDALKQINRQIYLTDEEVSPETVGKICFLFTGQGSQYNDMAKMLYICSPVFRMHFDQCLKILKEDYSINIRDVLWREENRGNEINRTVYSQTSIFCVEYALLKLWESWGVKPDFVLGHSLGEFCAAVGAGFLTLKDAIKLVAERSKLIDGLQVGKMLVVQADTDILQALIKDFKGNDENNVLDVAAINSSTQTVVAGDEDIMMEFSGFCNNRKIKNILLSSTHAFHSRRMDPISDIYRNVAKSVKIGEMKSDCKFISGLRGNIVEPEDLDEEYWIKHAREKVNFLDASKKAVEVGCRIFIEIGPQPVLSALTMVNTDTNITCLPSLQRNKDEWETILTSLGKLYLKGVEIDWNGFDDFYNRQKCHCLPHYPFKGKKYWPEFTKCEASNQIHPLIGSCLDNASNVKIFQNGINLEAHSYLEDHAIGQTVIIPGAGFLEMCLAAGLATIENSSILVNSQIRRAMKVENLMIKAPLAFEDGKTCQVQTVVDTKILTACKDNEFDLNELSIKIFHRQEDSNWLEHAEATFSPVPTAEELVIEFDSGKFMETIRKPSDEEIMTNFYNKLGSIGLNFGPIFKSLETIWRENNNSNSLIAKVKIPENTGEYLVHPVVLDAMIQAIMVTKTLNSGSKTKLYVPIKIVKYLWMSSPQNYTSQLYVHVYENASNSRKLGVGYLTNSLTALLVDETGKIIGLMSNVELIDTTVKAIESVIEQQTCKMPDLWEEIWKPEISPSQYRHDLLLLHRTEKFYDDKFINEAGLKFNRFGEKQKKVFVGLERHVYLNFVRCLYNCGWKPELDAIFTNESLKNTLKIKDEYSKMLGYVLNVLNEENILEKIESSKWKIKNLPISFNELNAELSSSSDFMVNLVKDFKSTELLAKLGNNYSEIMQGNQSALSILFPGQGQDNSLKETRTPSLADYYMEYGKFFDLKEMYCEIIRAQLKNYKGHMKTNGDKKILRILEVGAGTGSFTLMYLQMLEASGLEFEYAFTDISPAFFDAAEKKLERYLKHVNFKKLNIEEDPLSQGFTPNYYDIIIACDVIHAIRDLKEGLENVRMLMRENGLFIMAEQTRKNRILTCLVGLLDGFWRFEDAHIRKDHCTVSMEKWKGTLEFAGFDGIQDFPTLDNYHSLIYACKGEQKTQFVNSVQTRQNLKYWLYFHQEDSKLSREIIKRLSELTNRQVISVNRGQNFMESKTNSNTWSFTVRSDQEYDFLKLMDSLEFYCNSKNLEGIVYAWSLDTKTASSQSSVLQPYFYMIKSLLNREMSTKAKIISLLSNIMPIEGNSFSNFNSSTIVGFSKSLKNERPGISCKCVDIGAIESLRDMDHVFYELWNTDNNIQVAYSTTDNKRYTCRLHSLNATLSPLKLPTGTDRFQLVLPETTSVDDVQFDILEPFILLENEIEVQIKAMTINSRNIFNDEQENAKINGFDFVGIVKRVGSKNSKWSVGDRVFGRNATRNLLPSLVKLDENNISKIPEAMSFCEACTLTTITQAISKPTPYTRFDAVHIREALEYLQKGKHAEKVVCVMPEIRMHNGKREFYTPMFNEFGTYLITGGLGGIGFALCKWMIELGAKNLILAGRKVPSELMRDSIEKLNVNEQVNVVPVQLDVSNFEECEKLINGKIGEMGLPPLKGIMHAAGILQDSLIDNLNWTIILDTFKAKVDGTLNLHNLTTHLHLEHFVMFSSMSAILGLPGQSNHAAANMFEDSIAHYRQSIGLRATSVNWGQWGEVGIATEMEIPGLKTMPTLQALKGLEYAMKSQRPQTCVSNISSFKLLKKLISNIGNIVDPSLMEKGGDGSKNSYSSNIDLQVDSFWQRYDKSETISGRKEILREKLRYLVGQILKWDDKDAIEDNTKFQEMGVDSLMFVELKNGVQTLLGNRITVNATALKDCDSINMLTDTIIKIVDGVEVVKEEKPLTQSEVNKLMKEDCILSENIRGRVGQVKTGIRDVSKVLLTGCTGVLGLYILKELLSMPQIKTVYCLMRPRRQISARDRLEKILQERELLGQVDLSKVTCVSGNVAKYRLGMDYTIWEELCKNIDAIFHCAANVNHVELYNKRNKEYEDVRTVNINGLKNLLEFACTGGKLKHVYCASSIYTVLTVDKDGCVSEDWPEANSYEDFTNLAYPISKFVGDVIMKTAVLERGIPGKVFRFPVIMGDSKTGRFALDGNHFMLRFLFMLKNGMMPSISYPFPTLPVDICAGTSVKLFFSEGAADDIYNVVNVTPDVEQEFVNVARKLGYEMEIVEHSEFCQRLHEFTPEESQFAMFRDLYSSEEDFAGIYNKSQVIQQYILDAGSNKEFMVSKKIRKYVPEFYNDCVSSMDQIYRDLVYAKEKGWFALYNV